MMAQKKLKDNGIDEFPNELLINFLPGLRLGLVPQMLMTSAVVDKKIVTRQNETLAAANADNVKKVTDMKDGIIALAKNADKDKSTSKVLLQSISQLSKIAGVEGSVQTRAGGKETPGIE